MSKMQSLQDTFLAQFKGSKQQITIFLMNGFQLRGIVTGYDNFTVVLEFDGKQQLIYKHAISTMIPAKNVNFGDSNFND